MAAKQKSAKMAAKQEAEAAPTPGGGRRRKYQTRLHLEGRLRSECDKVLNFVLFLVAM